MKLHSAKAIQEVLARHSAGPSKRLGQNFLIDENILNKIVEAAAIQADETILEVGPGMGVLTAALAQKAKRVVAVEKDDDMLDVLQETIQEFSNVEIVKGDILKTDLSLYIEGGYKVVANIPYYLTSPFIRMLLENKNPPKEIILMIQKEVAKRICSAPPDMSLLAAAVQYYADPKIIFPVSKNSFWPIPNVDSAIIKITPRRSSSFAGQAPRQTPDAEKFFKIVRAGFSQPRKQLAGNLAKSLDVKKEAVEAWLKKNNIQPNQRAETLSVEDWVNLTNTYE